MTCDYSYGLDFMLIINVLGQMFVIHIIYLFSKNITIKNRPHKWRPPHRWFSGSTRAMTTYRVKMLYLGNRFCLSKVGRLTSVNCMV